MYLSHYKIIGYLTKVNKNIPQDKYEPVSYEQWKMLREIMMKGSQPAEFTESYQGYLSIKQKQYEAEVERKKNVTMELKTIMVTVNLSQPELLILTKNQLTEIQNQQDFIKWTNQEQVDHIMTM